MMTDVEKIENALDELLTAIIEHDVRRAKLAQLQTPQIAETPVVGLMTKAVDEHDLGSLVQDPVRQALRYSVKRLGGHLFRLLGNTDAMRDVLERVAARDQRHYHQRANIMDKKWGGIGSGRDIWVRSTGPAAKDGADGSRARHHHLHAGLWSS